VSHRLEVLLHIIGAEETSCERFYPYLKPVFFPSSPLFHRLLLFRYKFHHIAANFHRHETCIARGYLQHSHNLTAISDWMVPLPGGKCETYLRWRSAVRSEHLNLILMSFSVEAMLVLIGTRRRSPWAIEPKGVG